MKSKPMDRKLFVKSVGGAMVGAGALGAGEVAAQVAEEPGDRAIVLRPGDTLWVNIDSGISVSDAEFEDMEEAIHERTGWPKDRIMLTKGVGSIDVVRKE